MKKNIIISVLSILLGACIIYYAISVYSSSNKSDIKFVAIKSEADLKKVLAKETTSDVFKKIFTLPISIMYNISYNRYNYITNSLNEQKNSMDIGLDQSEASGASGASGASSSNSSENYSSDYSKTNIQVENVDEADVVKTDGLYLYSISGANVVISSTNAQGKVTVVSKITPTGTPEDLLVYKDKLVVISHVNGATVPTSSSYSGSSISISAPDYYPYYNESDATQISIYNTTDKANPTILKDIRVDKDYYTCRMIEDRVYVITTGYLNSSKEEVVPYYSVDGVVTKMEYGNIRYIKGKKTTKISMIATVDLANLSTGVDISGYLIPTDNAYVSENNMYIVSEEYKSSSDIIVSKCMKELFGLKGIPGFLKYMEDERYDEEDNSGTYTTIAKFDFTDNGIEYAASAKEFGNTVNQFSMDEYKGNLRITLSDSNRENKLIVYSSEMKKIGEITGIAKGEKIYSTRFIKDRAYVVTYKTMDPLFVIDLANPNAPKILGELKIPGYSTYLHPYDETHIIGIGNDTEETIYRDAFGRVISTRAYITGMKMAIFDVSDVANPVQQFSQKIGDASTYSSVLQNHKALLFSKEKELLAIPINNYNQKILMNTSTDMAYNINLIDDISGKPTRNGYIVYKINLTDGFKIKGTISHDTTDDTGYYWYSNNNPVRGLYIDNILYTISDKYIKANTLDKLEEKSSVKI